MPSVLAAISLLIILLQVLLKWALRYLHTPTQDPQEESPSRLREPVAGIYSEVVQHIKHSGGPVIFAYKVARLVGCVVLAALTVVTLVSNRASSDESFQLWKGHGKKPKHGGSAPANGFTCDELVQLSLLAFYV